jgi:hypothetical protein
VSDNLDDPCLKATFLGLGEAGRVGGRVPWPTLTISSPSPSSSESRSNKSDLGELKSTEEAVSRSRSLACWDIWRFWIAVCNNEEWAADIVNVASVGREVTW